MMKDWVLLTVKTDPILVSLLKGRLEEENIPVVTDQEAVGQIYGFNVGPMAEIKIFVPRSKLIEATNLLKELEDK